MGGALFTGGDGKRDVQFLTGVDGCCIDQNIRAYPPWSERRDSVDDVLPQLFVLGDFFVENPGNFVTEGFQGHDSAALLSFVRCTVCSILASGLVVWFSLDRRPLLRL